ncbi:hypothetical protein LSH36_1613g00003 [Paralvinella palmiformis]|uniref:Sulfatase N-terminal domain-containing protein n=1 Tax=Paralvinella palmiformis TaxID=53620 RepID=A0AAD9ISC7_9ANNE|nr:hypothetical protein LSH36_1613g00003 [Paralvinella palmiformis]
MGLYTVKRLRYLGITLSILTVGLLIFTIDPLRKEYVLQYPHAHVDNIRVEHNNTEGRKEVSKKQQTYYKKNRLRHITTVYKQILQNISIKAEHKLGHLLNTSTGSLNRKNVLFIMSDDLRPQLGSYWGRNYPNPFTNLKPHTPHLDRLASSSLLLTRAYVQYSLCGPSRASLLTGRRPDTVTTWNLETKFREVQRNFTTLPEYFKDNGYISINLGKIFHQGHGWKNDFQSWNIPEPQEVNNFQGLYRSRLLLSNEVSGFVTPDQREGNMLTPDESLTQYSVNYLRRLAPYAKSGNANFFLGVGYHRPHLPWICSKEFYDLFPVENVDLPREENKYYPKHYPLNEHQPHLELLRHVLNKTTHEPNEILSDYETKYYRRAYFACVSFVDDMVGILLDEVEKLGLSESTVIIFLGDHGWHLGENSLWGKRSTFEQSNHTPLMIKIPGVTDNGIVSDALVEFIDIFPTLVEAAGLPLVPVCPRQSRELSLCTEGTSFLPLIDKPSSLLKTAALSQLYYDGKMGYSVKTERYRYTEWIPLNKTEVNKEIYDYHLMWNTVTCVELYDHVADPEENVNLAYEDTHRDVVFDHNSMLKELIGVKISHVNLKLF